jgi:phosphatidylglycerophosphate synthase
VGALLFHGQSVLDGCDGEMSRVTHRGSLLGEWLDTIGDDITNYSFFGAAAWGLYVQSDWAGYLIAGAVAVGSGVVASGIEYRYLLKIGSGDLLKYPLSSGETAGRFSVIQPLFKRDTFVLLTFLAAVADLLGPMLFVFGAGAVGVLIGVIRTEFRLARQAKPSARSANS